MADDPSLIMGDAPFPNYGCWPVANSPRWFLWVKTSCIQTQVLDALKLKAINLYCDQSPDFISQRRHQTIGEHGTQLDYFSRL